MDDEYFRKHVTIDGLDILERHLKEKRGVILASAHLGNWELAQIALTKLGFPMKVVARAQPMSRLNDLLNRYRNVVGTETIERGMAMRDALRTLREGKTLAMLMDQSGRAEGCFVPFFGRLTSFPLGAFQLARRTNAVVLPGFMVRRGRHQHFCVIYENEVQQEAAEEKTALRRDVEYYVHRLEKHVRQYPEQWLWMHKRWKHTRTKYIAVLVDGKTGHTAQSYAILEQVKNAYREANEANELIVNEVPVTYKSAWHRRAAYVVAFLFLPWLEGRLRLISWTLTRESASALLSRYADVVISSGFGLLPIHAALARETGAKKIVIMKPAFPYSLLRYDVALVPEHDRPSDVKESFFLDLAPNLVNPELLTEAGTRLRREQALPEGRYIVVLIGGDTKGYRMDLSKLDFAFREIRRIAKKFDKNLLVTTSRRTNCRVEALAKKHFSEDSRCSLLVIANEQNIDGVVYGLMDCAEVIVVTEESVSMISESITSGKSVLVLKISRGAMKPKFDRFHQILRLKNYAAISTTGELARELSALLKHERPLTPCLDRKRVSERLEATL